MNPRKILIFFLSILALLAFISLVFPKDGIMIKTDFSLHFPSLKDIFFPEKVEYADISNIVNTDPEADTLSLKTVADGTCDTIRADAEKLIANMQHFVFPRSKKDLLHPVFRALKSAPSYGKPLRILHYGDSQIEGDRITSFIRSRLHYAFGGYGPGLIPIIEVAPSFSIKRAVSPNWKRYPGFGKKDESVQHNRYGALMSFCRYAPVQVDTAIVDSISYEAWVILEKSNSAYGPAKRFDQLKLFYGNNKLPVLLEVYADDELIKNDSLPGGTLLDYVSVVFNTPPTKVKLVFKGNDSPDIYGIALDGLGGIAIDNIPLRGSAGTIFTRQDFGHLSHFYKSLNVRMLILQFGGNVMPYIEEDKEVTNYGNWFYSNLLRLKKLIPGVRIVVIGVSDMSTKHKEQYITYPHLEKVRDALKEASMKAGCAYWDMYEAMGGENSMPSWVFAEPPLASKDFTHFLPTGARIIANMFYNALIYEYNLYNQSAKNASKPETETSDKFKKFNEQQINSKTKIKHDSIKK